MRFDAAEGKAAGRHTVASYAAALNEEIDLIAKFRDAKGVELTTIHGAKGREWKWVIVVGADQEVLPHKKTLETATDKKLAVEEERRLAYVAFTRTKERLTVLHAEAKSRYLAEAEVAFSGAQRERIGFEEQLRESAAGLRETSGCDREADPSATSAAPGQASRAPA